MSNLTFDEKLIREHRAEPLEGHAVVVLERVGESGEKFHSLLEPGDERPSADLLATLFRRARPYFAFAVDASKGRSLHFAEHVEMSERAHGFELQFSLWYRAADPQLLVATRESDPLERVRKKVAEVVTEEIAELPWSDVWHSFRVESERVVSRTLGELRTFARDYGISITSLRLRAKFPADALETDRKIHEVREKGRLARERMEVVQDIKIHRSSLRRGSAEREEEDSARAARRTYQDTVAGVMTKKVGELIGQASSVDELRQIQDALSGEAGMFGSGPHHETTALPSVNGHPPRSLPPGDELGAVLDNLIASTDQLGDAQCRRIRASLLHVVASVVADDSRQVTGEQAGYARQARQVLDDAAPHLSANGLQKLRNLADPQDLRRRLYPEIP